MGDKEKVLEEVREVKTEIREVVNISWINLEFTSVFREEID